MLHSSGRPVKCHVCDGNHFANDPACPRRSERITWSSTAVPSRPNTSTPSSSSQSPSSQSSDPTSSAASPASTANSVRGNAINVTAGSATPSSATSPSVSTNSVSLFTSSVDRSLSAVVVIPAQLTVLLMMKIIGCVYSTLIDTGAEVCFADAPLVKSWGVSVTPPPSGGKVRMAHFDFCTDRSGSAMLDATALFPSSDRKAVSFRCSFELLPIHGAGVDYHFIIGRDLIRVLFAEGSLPMAYLPQQTSSSVTVVTVASSTLVDSLGISPDAGVLGTIPPDDQPDKIRLFTPDELEVQYAVPRQHLSSVPTPS